MRCKLSFTVRFRFLYIFMPLSTQRSIYNWHWRSGFQMNRWLMKRRTSTTEAERVNYELRPKFYREDSSRQSRRHEESRMVMKQTKTTQLCSASRRKTRWELSARKLWSLSILLWFCSCLASPRLFVFIAVVFKPKLHFPKKFFSSVGTKVTQD